MLKTPIKSKCYAKDVVALGSKAAYFLSLASLSSADEQASNGHHHSLPQEPIGIRSGCVAGDVGGARSSLRCAQTARDCGARTRNRRRKDYRTCPSRRVRCD